MFMLYFPRFVGKGAAAAATETEQAETEGGAALTP